MDSLAVIPARLGATRLPNKPLRLLAGRPLVVRVWERVASLGLTDEVVVATDSEEVAAVVREAGGRVVMTRPDHPTGTDRVAEVASHPDFASASTLINVQGDEPFVTADVLRGALYQVAAQGFEIGTVAEEAMSSVLTQPDVVKVVRADTGRALYFSRAPIPWARDAQDEELRASIVLRHVGIYAYTRDALHSWVALPPHPLETVERLEQLRPLAAGMSIGVGLVDRPFSIDVNTEADLIRANDAWSSRANASTYTEAHSS